MTLLLFDLEALLPSCHICALLCSFLFWQREVIWPFVFFPSEYFHRVSSLDIQTVICQWNSFHNEYYIITYIYIVETSNLLMILYNLLSNMEYLHSFMHILSLHYTSSGGWNLCVTITQFMKDPSSRGWNVLWTNWGR